MPFRSVAALGLVLLLVGCETVPVEQGDKRNAALARLCTASVAASLKLRRDTVAARTVRSMPEGDEVTVDIPGGGVHCYVGLDGKVIAIRYVTVPPPEVETEAPLAPA